MAAIAVFDPIRRYGLNVLVSLDQFVNTLFGGDPDETISSRAAKAAARGRLWGRLLCRLLDSIDPGHSSSNVEPDEGSDAV